MVILLFYQILHFATMAHRFCKHCHLLTSSSWWDYAPLLLCYLILNLHYHDLHAAPCAADASPLLDATQAAERDSSLCAVTAEHVRPVTMWSRGAGLDGQGWLWWEAKLTAEHLHELHGRGSIVYTYSELQYLTAAVLWRRSRSRSRKRSECAVLARVGVGFGVGKIWLTPTGV